MKKNRSRRSLSQGPNSSKRKAFLETEMDDYELVKLVRALKVEQLRATPMVALTALARSEDRRRAMLAGFDLHMAKPVEPAELVAVVGRLARRV